MTNSVMKIESARKAFGGNKVLKDISLEVPDGQSAPQTVACVQKYAALLFRSTLSRQSHAR